MVVWLVILGVLAGGGYAAWKWKSGKDSKAQAWSAQASTVKVERADIASKVTESGVLEPSIEVKVKANATGTVKGLKAVLGAQVRKGQVLAVIQPGRPGEAYRPSTVLAPRDGVVISRLVEEGDMVTSGLSDYGSGTEILHVADLGTMMVKFQVNEVDISKVHVGQSASVSLDALPEKSYQGKLIQLSPMAQTQQGGSIRVFEAKVEVKNPNGELKPGMSATVEIVSEEHKKVLSLPVEAVFDEEGKQAVYRKRGQELKRVEVQTGLSDDHRVELTKGLEEGAVVSLQRPDDVAEKAKQNSVSGNEW
jgi:multidrug efflux pump subunit AcrA (membrane-fusion protein)